MVLRTSIRKMWVRNSDHSLKGPIRKNRRREKISDNEFVTGVPLQNTVSLT